MSYIEYLKAKNNKEQNHPSTLDFAPALVNYGKIRCDLCGELCDVADIESETSTVTDAATGKQRFYHFCYKCLHKKMDINDIHGTFTEEETKEWRLKYKEAKKRTPRNTYEDMCLNCFISTNNIQMHAAGSPDILADRNEAYIMVDEGIDKYNTWQYNKKCGAAEVAEFHYTFSLRRCPGCPSDTLEICKGNGSMLCENCRFKKERE